MFFSKHPEATLPGFVGPYYPENLADELTKLLIQQGAYNLTWLEAVCQQVEGFYGNDRLMRTDDAYEWSQGLRFHDGKGGITLFLVDFTHVPAPRAVAVYNSIRLDHPTRVEVAGQLQQLINAIRANPSPHADAAG